MKIEFDPIKNAENRLKHGLDFVMVEGFDFDSALIVVDDRRDYGEVRYQALGQINGLVVLLIFTMRGPTQVRVISLRPASRKERKIWHGGK